MANFNDIELEKLSELYKKSQRKANALGADGDIFDEPFGLEQTIKMSDLYGGIRISDNFASPKYADYPSVGTIGTRRVKVRLHPLVGSGVGGNDSIQTFVCVHRAPASDSIDDIEAVRLKKLIPPDFSPRRKSAAEATTTVRGFAIALYPAEEVSGVLEAYESNGPIPYGVDPGSAYGMGNGKWFIDYANGIVRFSVSPLNGSAGLMNPNNVYGDLNGNSISASSGGRITMFATFYVYEPRAIIPEYDGYDLGSTTSRWNEIFCTSANVDGYIYSSGKDLNISAGVDDINFHSRIVHYGPNDTNIIINNGEIAFDVNSSGSNDGYIYSDGKDLNISAGVDDINFHSKIVHYGPNENTVVIDNGNIFINNEPIFGKTFYELDGYSDEFSVSGHKSLSIIKNSDMVCGGDIWRIFSDLNVANDSLAGSGNQGAALAFGGYNRESTSYINNAEYSSGNLWTQAGVSLNTARQALSGSGSQTSALAFGGYDGSASAITEKSIFVSGVSHIDSWVISGNLNFARSTSAGCGTQNAALSAGGFNGVSETTTAEKFNGSAWSLAADLNIARFSSFGIGKQNSSLVFGGLDISTVVAYDDTEKFNGSVWIISNNLNTARGALAGSGIQNAALAFGGYDTTTESIVTEKFNGFSWFVTGSMNVQRDYLFGCGTQNAALGFGGLDDGDSTSQTEAFYGSVLFDVITTVISNDSIKFQTKDLNVYIEQDSIVNIDIEPKSYMTDEEAFDLSGSDGYLSERFDKMECFNSQWVVTGSLNTARYGLAGSGTQNSTLSFGGNDGSVSTKTEKFNTSSWAATGDLATARSFLAGCGTQNAALSFGGYDGSLTLSVSEKFNIVSWSSTGNLNVARNSLGGCGVQNAALSFGGANVASPVYATTEKFNISSWSLTGDLNVGRIAVSGCGTQNSALCFNGAGGLVEKFNGSVWAATSGLNVIKTQGAGCGAQNSALSFGGSSSLTEKFNGIVWTMAATLNVSRNRLGGSGTQLSALSFGGQTYDTTEKFNILFFVPDLLVRYGF